MYDCMSDSVTSIYIYKPIPKKLGLYTDFFTFETENYYKLSF